jgi:hypothetical protein
MYGKRIRPCTDAMQTAGELQMNGVSGVGEFAE